MTYKLTGNEYFIKLWVSRFQSWTNMTRIAGDRYRIVNALKLLVADSDDH